MRSFRRNFDPFRYFLKISRVGPILMAGCIKPTGCSNPSTAYALGRPPRPLRTSVANETPAIYILVLSNTHRPTHALRTLLRHLHLNPFLDRCICNHDRTLSISPTVTTRSDRSLADHISTDSNCLTRPTRPMSNNSSPTSSLLHMNRPIHLSPQTSPPQPMETIQVEQSISRRPSKRTGESCLGAF